MNCDETRELFGLISDLPPDHPERVAFNWHIMSCESCAAEYAIWQESLEIIQDYAHEVTYEQGEAINRSVMARIFAERDSLADALETGTPTTRGFRSRLAMWAAGCFIVFICSSLFFVFSNSTGQSDKITSQTGILPAAVATTGVDSTGAISVNLSNVSRGIVAPFVAQIGPTYPQYWMILSIAGMGLVLFSWKGLRRIKK
ncbi:zf-HC2 domain-containing protein [Paenibacillus turicensis]|uniref:zf-HC2 domain-containing protein n=1 Tax=Paenibacillus turicensis TaxID=160487 RepID=UPI003D270314